MEMPRSSQRAALTFVRWEFTASEMRHWEENHLSKGAEWGQSPIGTLGSLSTLVLHSGFSLPK